jgi:hypothetical protein
VRGRSDRLGETGGLDVDQDVTSHAAKLANRTDKPRPTCSWRRSRCR